jgi:prepilin-type N-terminal cleavage/methylation domain-containing protein/prepilin-type processing-associated H-X9-DG protein
VVCFQRLARRGAFTLIELMLVIAIVGILAVLLLPALARSKARAQAIWCMSNNKQLAYAWTMYSNDNNDQLAYNQGPNMSTLSFPPATSPNWVNNIMDWETGTDNTNLNFVYNSILAPYAGLSTHVFHCPSDNTLSTVQRGAGWTGGRVRSVSMNGMVGDAGVMLHGGINIMNTNYVQFLKDNDVRDPSGIYVFLDEHPNSIDDGYFLIDASVNQWQWGLPASYHNGGGSFAFADGHTEIHLWQCSSTMQPTAPGATQFPVILAPNDLADFNWVVRHTSYNTY